MEDKTKQKPARSGPDTQLIEAIQALYVALEPLTPDKRLRLMSAMCVLLNVPLSE